MNKRDLTRGVARKLSVSRAQSNRFVIALQDVIIEELQKNGTIMLQGFGAFSPWIQSKRMGRNPRNGQLHIIEPRISVKFRPGKNLLRKLNSDYCELIED